MKQVFSMADTIKNSLVSATHGISTSGAIVAWIGFFMVLTNRLVVALWLGKLG